MSARRSPLWIWCVGVWLAVAILVETRGPSPAPPAPAAVLRGMEVSLDPERMSARELRRLPGVGERRALAITGTRLEARRSGAPWTWTDVSGIGPRTEEKVLRWLGERDAPDP